ncbi:MFS transporter [uncultured Streptomyces sp.]|uniref:MFS transporter n=1 Tax=uncultured Streptomyces sp. TaxID=174707 RepID=UPI002612386E|nr:MFS transporter [uncultured Streptomyces sp.]
MRTYRELFRVPEFTPLFAAACAGVAGRTLSGLALGTLVYGETGSPLSSALAMFAPSLAQVLGAATLLSAADRLPPRAALTGLALLTCAATALLALPGFPLWAAFAVLLSLGVVSAPAGGVRYGLLNEVLAQHGYLLGRSLLNMSTGLMQIAGYGTGAVLLVVLSPRGALLVAAALHLAAALTARYGLLCRPPRASGRLSVAATWRINRLLWASPPRRYVFLALWVPNGLIVGCESLFVPYAPRHAGLLFACAALGMLAGDVLTGRFLPPRWRARLAAPMRLLLAVPYLLFAYGPPLPVAAAAVVLASVGYAASLLLQERLLALTPERRTGQALGLHSSGTTAVQGAGAALAGGVAQYTSPTAAMAVMAVLSVAVTLVLAPGLRPAAGVPAGGAAGAEAAGEQDAPAR